VADAVEVLVADRCDQSRVLPGWIVVRARREITGARNDFMALAGGLGFLGFSNVQIKIANKTAVDTVAIADAIAARNAARKNKDFKESDRIRDDLLAKGIVLKDGPGGTTWEVKR